MWNRRWSPRHQFQATNSENTAFTSTWPQTLQKRASRRLWIVLCLFTSMVVLICFPTRTTLYTWKPQITQVDRSPQLGLSPVVINVKEGPFDWQNRASEKGIPNLGVAYHPKSSSDLGEAFGSYDEPAFANKNVKDGAQPAQVADNPELPISQRLVVKKPPLEKFESLPGMKLEPNLKYENVTPNLHPLTNELDKTNFLTYLPHSGFHNQRIEVGNAFRLAKLLNRTLILPAFRLGTPVPWKNSSLLTKVLEDDQKKYHRLLQCLNSSPRKRSKLEQRSLRDRECNRDSRWTSVQVGYVINIEELVNEVPVVDRIDLSESWLWKTLKLSPGEWLEVPDDTRHSYQIYESAQTKSIGGLKYDWRLNISDLAQFSEVRLLSFGSLFGSERVVVSSPEMQRWNLKVKKNQFFSLPLLERISDRIANQLGGRGKYVGLHLRIGNGGFKTQASELGLHIFNEICQKVFRLDQKTIDKLILKHESIKKLTYGTRKTNKLKSSSQTLQGDNLFPAASDNFQIPKYKNVNAQYKSRRNGFQTRAIEMSSQVNQALKRKIHRTSQSTLKCDGKPLTENNEYFDKINTPFYISTDVSVGKIRTNPDLSIIFDSFPCVFSFDDLTALMQDDERELMKQSKNQKKLKSIQKHKGDERDGQFISSDQASEDEFIEDFFKFTHIKSNLDGLNLDRFLFPMLESMIVSKGSHIIGTPGSTFSAYAVDVLHPAYLLDKLND